LKNVAGLAGYKLGQRIHVMIAHKEARIDDLSIGIGWDHFFSFQ